VLPRESIALLAQELKKRDLRLHVEHLREFWFGRGPWNEKHVVGLLRIFQIPPHAGDLPVRLRTHQCCGQKFVAHAFDDRHLAACLKCDDRWLVFDR
jgi:hypothetical protein